MSIYVDGDNQILGVMEECKVGKEQQENESLDSRLLGKFIEHLMKQIWMFQPSMSFSPPCLDS